VTSPLRVGFKSPAAPQRPPKHFLVDRTLNVGDYVFISFVDGDSEKACAILKAHKTR